jgi:hypothetical protein
LGVGLRPTYRGTHVRYFLFPLGVNVFQPDMLQGRGFLGMFLILRTFLLLACFNNYITIFYHSTLL